MPENSEAKKKDTVTLAINDWRVNDWDFKVQGVDPITQEGTEVPASKEQEVRKAAKKHGVELKKL